MPSSARLPSIGLRPPRSRMRVEVAVPNRHQYIIGGFKVWYPAIYKLFPYNGQRERRCRSVGDYGMKGRESVHSLKVYRQVVGGVEGVSSSGPRNIRTRGEVVGWSVVCVYTGWEGMPNPGLEA